MVSVDRYRFDVVAGNSLLLTEGYEDARFLSAFLRVIGKPEVQVCQVGGATNFRPFLSNTLIRAPNFPHLQKLGLIRDADANPQGALLSVSGALTRAGLPSPSKSWGEAHNDKLAVYVAIVPDGDSQGNLEDLCLKAVEKSYEGEQALVVQQL